MTKNGFKQMGEIDQLESVADLESVTESKITPNLTPLGNKIHEMMNVRRPQNAMVVQNFAKGSSLAAAASKFDNMAERRLKNGAQKRQKKTLF